MNNNGKMKYLLWITILNIVVNVSLKYARAFSVTSFSLFTINIVAYFSFVGFICGFILYSKASKYIDVSILFPLTKGGTIVGTVLVEYILFTTQISLMSGLGIVLILIGAFLLAPK